MAKGYAVSERGSEGPLCMGRDTRRITLEGATPSSVIAGPTSPKKSAAVICPIEGLILALVMPVISRIIPGWDGGKGTSEWQGPL